MAYFNGIASFLNVTTNFGHLCNHARCAVAPLAQYYFSAYPLTMASRPVIKPVQVASQMHFNILPTYHFANNDQVNNIRSYGISPLSRKCSNQLPVASIQKDMPRVKGIKVADIITKSQLEAYKAAAMAKSRAEEAQKLAKKAKGLEQTARKVANEAATKAKQLANMAEEREKSLQKLIENKYFTLNGKISKELGQMKKSSTY